MRLRILILLPIFGLMTACNYTVSKSHDRGGASGLDLPVDVDKDQVDFAMVLGNVIEPKCLSCHSSAGGNQGRINLETFPQVISHIGDIQAAIESGLMPLGDSLTHEQRALILFWISQGANEKPLPPGDHQPAPSPSPGPTPGGSTPDPGGPVSVPETVDFATVRKTVIATACLKCHAAPVNSGNVNLETYQEVLKHVSDIKSDVEDGSMPLIGKLTDVEKAIILGWIAAGTPENIH